MKKQAIALVLHCAPDHSSSVSAFRLAQTIASSDEAALSSIFFYAEGAYHALNAALDWNTLNVALGVCVASLQRRGTEATVASHFNIVGLGYLATLYQQNDKVIIFG